MPDIVIERMTGMPTRFRDMGDGTFAEVVTGPPGSAIVASDASLPELQPGLQTTAYATGQVLFTAVEVVNAAYVGRVSLLASVTLIDADDQGQPLDLYFFSGTASMGARGAAATAITDADANKFLGKVSVASGDWEDLGGARVAHVAVPSNRPLPIKGDAQAASLAGYMSAFVVGVTRGTPTHSATGLLIKPFLVR
jgi:hypothetical protein